MTSAVVTRVDPADAHPADRPPPGHPVRSTGRRWTGRDSLTRHPQARGPGAWSACPTRFPDPRTRPSRSTLLQEPSVEGGADRHGQRHRCDPRHGRRVRLRPQRVQPRDAGDPGSAAPPSSRSCTSPRSSRASPRPTPCSTRPSCSPTAAASSPTVRRTTTTEVLRHHHPAPGSRAQLQRLGGQAPAAGRRRGGGRGRADASGSPPTCTPTRRWPSAPWKPACVDLVRAYAGIANLGEVPSRTRSPRSATATAG